MKYRIIIRKAALKFIKKQDKTQQVRIFNAVGGLPFKGDIKILRGFDNTYRLRVGDYRILYTVDHDVLTVDVIKANNRGEIYK
ncbi:MAG: type II toxin-antitoxin system RelE/ParE family toxin [Ruminococcus sp.]|nr:type II toxin-antitoxin system RelE/ParE family toxin [Ruminococcus sp.]